MGRRSNWRDCQAWRDEGLEMSSTSNEAVKLYDASLSQLVGWYNEPSVGGFTEGVKKMLETDENFIMGHAMKNGLKWIINDGHKAVGEDEEASSSIETMCRIANTSTTINPREKKYVQMVKLLSEDRVEDGMGIIQEILLDYPTDMFAIKLGELGYFKTGDQIQQRDFKYRVVPHWNPNIPLYSHLFGMMAYGEMETCLFEKAEKNARKGLELNSLDGWASHVLAHTLDDSGKHEENIQVMTRNEKDWSTCEMLASHHYWHLALSYIAKGDTDAAIDIFDTQVGNAHRVTDKVALLVRLEMEGIDVGNRWGSIYEECRPHIDDHGYLFNDMHTVMACLGAKHREDAHKLLESLQEHIRSGPKTYYRRTAEKVGVHLFQAIIAYDEQDYGKTVELLMPIRYDVKTIGGSNAQRDMVNQLLIFSAMRSPQKEHRKISRNLINERRAYKDTPQTERLMQQLLNTISHD